MEGFQKLRKKFPMAHVAFVWKSWKFETLPINQCSVRPSYPQIMIVVECFSTSKRRQFQKVKENLAKQSLPCSNSLLIIKSQLFSIPICISRLRRVCVPSSHPIEIYDPNMCFQSARWQKLQFQNESGRRDEMEGKTSSLAAPLFNNHIKQCWNNQWKSQMKCVLQIPFHFLFSNDKTFPSTFS